MHNLTNIELANQYGRKPETHDDVAFRVYVASLRSGQNVKYLTCAMPDHWTAKNYKYNNYGHIVGFEKLRDYSDFWREYELLLN